jgi:hypothetical protein
MDGYMVVVGQLSLVTNMFYFYPITNPLSLFCFCFRLICNTTSMMKPKQLRTAIPLDLHCSFFCFVG